VKTSEPEGVQVSYTGTKATDAVSTPQVSYSMPSGSTFPPGKTEVTVTASDASGNGASCAFSVSVEVTQDIAVEEPQGCGCASGATSAAAWWLLLALSPVLARRRRGR
jgi:uncharacterized protein (TIGR03382 family)